MSTRRSLRSSLAGAAALAVVVVGTLVVQGLADDGAAPAGTSAPPAAVAPAPRSGSGGSGGGSGNEVRDGLPTVAVASLPAQARETLALIDAGGPFPYERDGVVFGNREGLLPRQRSGCYREYTVRTPGESDRGARRIITSCAGPRYWTADHYESFARIVPSRL